MTFLSQQYTFFLKEENHVEKEHADCETIPSVLEPIDSKSIINFIKE
jgi:hypothetical protein